MHAQEFKIHQLKGYIEEIYLIEYPNKIIMLDGASRSDVKLIENYITNSLQRPISDLKLIVSTHMHPDHAGAAPILRKKYKIPIAAFYECDQWYSGLKGHIQQQLDIYMGYYVVFKNKIPFKKFNYPAQLKPDILLEHGDDLPMFNDWKVLHTPGHTSHQIVLYNQKQKTLYAADVALRINNKCLLPFPIELKKMAKQSLQMLSELEIKTLLLAHGGICTDLNYKELFLNLIPKLYNKPQFPMSLLSYITGFNKPLKKYLKEEEEL